MTFALMGLQLEGAVAAGEGKIKLQAKELESIRVSFTERTIADVSNLPSLEHVLNTIDLLSSLAISTKQDNYQIHTWNLNVRSADKKQTSRAAAQYCSTSNRHSQQNSPRVAKATSGKEQARR